VPDANAISGHEDPDDVEAIALVGPAVAVDPNLGGLGQLLLLPPVNRLYRLTEPVATSRLHLDERNRALAFHDEIDVAMPRSKPPLDDPPPRPPQPPLGDALPQLPECLPGR